MQTHGEPANARDVIAFLQKDYELKVRYLTDHYSRMWTRFNFFMVATTALAIALCKALIDDRRSLNECLPFLSAGVILAACWYVFGAQDRYLVEAYRAEIRSVSNDLVLALHLDQPYKLNAGRPSGYVSISDMSDAHVRREIYQWRSEPLSTTKLVAWFPLLVLAVFLGLIIFATLTATLLTILDRMNLVWRQ